MKRIFVILVSLLLTASLLTACGNQTGLQDGYYTAQVSEFSHGWKEYITILVKGGSIVSVEYNAENASGFIKSWDNAYMQTMLHSNGTYPNEYTRYYAGQLLEGQGGNVRSTPCPGQLPRTDRSRSCRPLSSSRQCREIPALPLWIRPIRQAASQTDESRGVLLQSFITRRV